MFRRSFLKSVGLFFASLFGWAKTESVKAAEEPLDLGLDIIFDERKCRQCGNQFLTRSNYVVGDWLHDSVSGTEQGQMAEGTTSYCFCSRPCQDIYWALNNKHELRYIYRRGPQIDLNRKFLHQWTKVKMRDLHNGDVFIINNEDTDDGSNRQWTAVGEPYLNDKGVWTIQASVENLLETKER